MSHINKITPARQFDWYRWNVLIYVVGCRETGCPEGYADLHRDGAHICRIATANDNATVGHAIDALEARARAWIDDWQQRAHSGNTGFASL